LQGPTIACVSENPPVSFYISDGICIQKYPIFGPPSQMWLPEPFPLSASFFNLIAMQANAKSYRKTIES
jgi:hypothetical protein